MKSDPDPSICHPKWRLSHRLLDPGGHEIAWVNHYLDAQHIRQLSPRSLRAYAYDLLHFARWLQSQPQTLSEITESTLLDYVRHQLNQQPHPHRKP
jgi:site-specific recombinase XerD